MTVLGPLLWILFAHATAEAQSTDTPQIVSLWETRNPQMEQKGAFPPIVAKVPLSLRVTGLKAAEKITSVKQDNGKDSNLLIAPEPDKEGVVVRLGYLSRGKRSLTVKYKQGDAAEKELKTPPFEVSFPPAPAIETYFQDNDFPAKKPPAVVKTLVFYVNVTGIEQRDKVSAFLNDREVASVVQEKEGQDRITVKIDRKGLLPQNYKLKVRILRDGDYSDYSPEMDVNYDPCPEKGAQAVPPLAPAAVPAPQPRPLVRAVRPPDEPPMPDRAIPLHKRPTTAFFQMPRVREVPNPNHADLDAYPEAARASRRLRSLESEAFLRGQPLFQARFDLPAHFPYPRFGPAGEPFYEEGALIYEGMRFLATPDGQYEVQLTVSVPSMPVTLRLQLAVLDPAGASFPLTLPPIAIDPRPYFEGNYVGRAFQVRHAGFSRLVAENYANLCRCTVSRQGTARFGSWPQDINRYGLLTVTPVGTSSPDGSTGAADTTEPASPGPVP